MKQLYSDRQLAKKAEVSRATIWRWAKVGAIPKPIKIGGSTRWEGNPFKKENGEPSR
jgi:prophage regulatory protein